MRSARGNIYCMKLETSIQKKKNVHKMYSVDELQTTNCAELPVNALEK
jgi:hypothetical protein